MYARRRANKQPRRLRQQRDNKVLREGKRDSGEGLLTLLRKAILTAAGLSASGAGVWLWAQERPTFRIKVDMVVLSFEVTDSKGHYINGLKPSDFKIFEDGIVQKLNTFGEGNKPPLQVMDDGSTRPLMANVPGPASAEGKP